MAKSSRKDTGIKEKLKKVKYFIWDDDSLLSWLVNVVLAFVLVYFVIYPGLGLLLGTAHPVVAVVSGSMEHKTVHNCINYDYLSNRCVERDDTSYRLCGEYFEERHRVDFDFFWDTCGDWYKDYNITKEDFSDFPMRNGFNTGDIIVLRGSEPENIEIGDVIVFQASRNYPIIHRVVDKEDRDGEIFFTTKGDHNDGIGPDDKNISQEQVIGKSFFRIPYLGWIKLGAHWLLHLFIP